MSVRARLAAVLVAAAVGAAAAQPPPAAPRPTDPVQIELRALAEEVAKALAVQKQTAVRVGNFAGDGAAPTEFGPEIRRVLIAELGEQKVKVTADAPLELKGDYGPATDPGVFQNDLMFNRVQAKLVDAKTRLEVPGTTLNPRAVFGNAALARAFAPTVTLPAKASLQSRNHILQEVILNPKKATAHVAGARVRSDPNSPFAVEVLVTAGPKDADPDAGRPVALKDGLPHVAIEKGEYYRLRLHNAAAFDAAVRVSIDGLDRFEFSDPEFRDGDRPRFEHVFVPRGGSAVVAGWFRRIGQLDSFVVTQYANSPAAALLKPRAGVGQVVVQFHATWENERDRPADEPAANVAGRDATARGPVIDVKHDVLDRTVGPMRSQVAIRYAK